MEYILFRYGETEFGAAVRSDHWAMAMPRGGHGVVFGGSAHFTNDKPLNVQDFIQERDPSVTFVRASAPVR